MKKILETVQQIESHCVGNDCVQIMLPYKNEMAMFDKNGLIFLNSSNFNIMINKYLEDERRKQFPYSNIPIHRSKIGLFNKFNYANQLLDFETPYIRFVDGYLIESFAVKDRNKVLLIQKEMNGTKKSIYVTREELENFYKETENKFVLHVENNGLKPANDICLPKETTILHDIKHQIAEGAVYIKNYGMFTSGNIYQFLSEHPVFLDYIEQSNQCVDMAKMELNIPIQNGYTFIVKTNSNDISIQIAKSNFISINRYRIDIIDMPTSKYTLEQLKYLSKKIFKTKEPSIPLKLNPNITKQDIDKSKQMIKKLDK